MYTGEEGTEVDVGMGPANQENKGGSFKGKFKQSDKTSQTPTQVWTDKYRLLLKSNALHCN